MAPDGRQQRIRPHDDRVLFHTRRRMLANGGNVSGATSNVLVLTAVTTGTPSNVSFVSTLVVTAVSSLVVTV